MRGDFEQEAAGWALAVMIADFRGLRSGLVSDSWPAEGKRVCDSPRSRAFGIGIVRSKASSAGLVIGGWQGQAGIRSLGQGPVQNGMMRYAKG